MADDVRVLRMLETLMESGGEPEDLCSDCPDLLPSLRAQWEQCRRLDAKINALFGESGETSADSSGNSSATDRVPRETSDGFPVLPGYDVIAIEGRGGMGVVYRARHLKLNRIVALKMLVNGSYAGRVERARFLREAQAVAALRHPNIVQVHDVGELHGRPFFTMEFVEGKTLAHMLAGEPQPGKLAIEIALTLADAVQSAHDCGIIHRDLKPANILLTPAGIPKVSDFGLAWRSEGDDLLTLAGTRLGTPSYMAPEQAFSSAGTVGPATDVYALGAILYEMLTGRPPFKGESPAETERQLLAEDPVPPAKLNARVSRDLQTICMMCLQKDARRRYQTAAAFGADLRRLQRGEPIMARQTSLLERAAKWMRRHPALATAVTFVALTIAAAVAIGTWMISQRNATDKVVEEQLREVVQLQQRGSWKDADAAMQRAALRLGSGGSAAVRNQLDRTERDSELAARLDEISLAHSQSRRGVVNNEVAEDAYRAAFKDFGVGTEAEDARIVAQRIKTSSIRTAIVAALYDWMLGPQAAERAWLQDLIREVDEDPTGWHQRVRDPATWNDGKALAAVVVNAPVEQQSVPFLLAIGGRLQSLHQESLEFLRKVQSAYPQDFWANMAYGDELKSKDKFPEALRFYQAAIAIRPLASTAYNALAMTLNNAQRPEDACAAFRIAMRLDPSAIQSEANLALALVNLKRYDEAIVRFNAVLKRDPHQALLWCFLGVSLDATGHPDDALAAYRRGVATDPKYEYGWKRLHQALNQRKLTDEAFGAWRHELAEIPKDTNAWEGFPEYCLHLNRPQAYEEARAQQLEIFQYSTDPIICERVGRTCLLRPATPEMLAAATQLIQSAVEKERGKVLYSYFMFSRGLAEYRAEHFESAIAIMSGPAAPTYQPGTAIVQAMAEYRLGKVDPARARFAKAVAGFNWNQPDTNDHQVWLYEVLRHEAEALMQPVPAAK